MLDKAHRNSAWATLPVRMRNGEIELVAWGRRPGQAGKLPLGGTAFRDGVLAGNWDCFKPRAVRLWVEEFAEQDVVGKVRWHPVTKDKWIKGLLAQEGAERRVYVITVKPILAETPYDRWPRIESG